MSYRFALAPDGAPVLLVAVAEAPPEDPAPDRAKGSDHRRRDAVVDAARTLEDLSPAGVEQHVRRRWRGDRAITPEDISSFSSDARAQRMHDVVDALDHRIHQAVHGRLNSKRTHVSIPRGVVKKSLSQLDGEEVATVVARLRDRGWSDQQIKRHGVRRFDADGRAIKALSKGKVDG